MKGFLTVEAGSASLVPHCSDSGGGLSMSNYMAFDIPVPKKKEIKQPLTEYGLFRELLRLNPRVLEAI